MLNGTSFFKLFKQYKHEHMTWLIQCNILLMNFIFSSSIVPLNFSITWKWKLTEPSDYSRIDVVENSTFQRNFNLRQHHFLVLRAIFSFLFAQWESSPIWCSVIARTPCCIMKRHTGYLVFTHITLHLYTLYKQRSTDLLQSSAAFSQECLMLKNL